MSPSIFFHFKIFLADRHETHEEDLIDENKYSFDNNTINRDEFNIRLDRSCLREFDFATSDDFNPALVASLNNIEQQSPIIERELLTTEQEL